MEKFVTDSCNVDSFNEVLADAFARSAMQQENDRNTTVFLFEEDRSGRRMGKPGDANNLYFAKWFEFYSMSNDGKVVHEGTSLEFKDPNTGKTVPGGNGISETDVIEKFRHANLGKNVVVLGIETSKGNVAACVERALQEYKENGKALVTLPSLAGPDKDMESSLLY